MQKAPKEIRFAVMAVDAVIFGLVEDQLSVLIAPVSTDSTYKGMEAFPGGLIQEKETAEQAVERILADKAGLTVPYLEQLYTFSAIDRDRRDRVVSVAYEGMMRPDDVIVYSHGAARFVPVQKVPNLAYDHNQILKAACKRLEGKITYTNVAQFLLPRHFTLTELQTVYEAVLKMELDKRNFRKKILALGLVKDTGRVQEGVQNRPAALYEFSTQKLVELPLLV